MSRVLRQSDVVDVDEASPSVEDGRQIRFDPVTLTRAVVVDLAVLADYADVPA